MEKLEGFEFWRKTLKSAKFVVAPMVDASELAWRMLSRRYGAELCYTPMLNACVFARDVNYRNMALASCEQDRPLIVQFCGNDPEVVVTACRLAEDHCDGIDLNLGCPQSIAKRGHYGAFLQDEWSLIESIVSRCSKELKVPFTAKIRVFEDKEKTVRYAQMLERAGCQVLTVHGRTREQKGVDTGMADWSYVKAVKEAVSIPVFSNGNIQYIEDVHKCMRETGVDGVMIAEGSLHNPALFAGVQPCVWDMAAEYLDLVQQYPCPLSYTRGHLFKIFQHALTVHKTLRQKLSVAKNLEQMREVVDDIKTASQADYEKGAEAYKGNLPHPYWICQPYVRPPPVGSTDTQPDKSAMRDLDLEGVKRSLSPSQTEKGLSKNQLKKLKKNPNKKFTPAQHTFEKCSCGKPRGQKCDHESCKACCKTKVYLLDKPCAGHRFKVKLIENSNESSTTPFETADVHGSVDQRLNEGTVDDTPAVMNGLAINGDNAVKEGIVTEASEINDRCVIDTENNTAQNSNIS